MTEIKRPVRSDGVSPYWIIDASGHVLCECDTQALADALVVALNAVPSVGDVKDIVPLAMASADRLVAETQDDLSQRVPDVYATPMRLGVHHGWHDAATHYAARESALSAERDALATQVATLRKALERTANALWQGSRLLERMVLDGGKTTVADATAWYPQGFKFHDEAQSALALPASDAVQQFERAWMIVHFVDDLLRDRANPTDIWHQIELTIDNLRTSGALRKN